MPAWILSQRRTRYDIALAARMLDWAVVAAGLLVIIGASWYVRSVVVGNPSVNAWLEATRRDSRIFYIVLTLTALALALGPPYGIWRWVYWLPGMNFIRANSRFMLVALLGLAMLAGFGFDRLSRSWTRRTRHVAAAILAAVLVAEYAAMPMRVRPARVEIPAVDWWLDSRPKPFVVAEVPVVMPGDPGGLEGRQTEYMIHSTAHWQKTVHGYSGWRTDLHNELYAKMIGFPDDASIDGLSELDVNYVVVHADAYPPGQWAAIDARLQQYAARLRLEHADGDGRVYAIVNPGSDRGARHEGTEPRNIAVP
jgi:hypothetical protein